MIKEFEYCIRYQNNNKFEFHSINIDTDGLIDDWYPKLWHKLSEYVIGGKYYNRPIVEIYGWENRHEEFGEQINGEFNTRIGKEDVIISYLVNDHHPNGMWFGQWFATKHLESCKQYPDKIGILDLLDTRSLIKKQRYQKTAVAHSKINASKAINDAIRALEILRENNITTRHISEEYDYVTYDLINRLHDAELWIDRCKVYR